MQRQRDTARSPCPQVESGKVRMMLVQTIPPEFRDPFARELEREIVSSERRRVTFLAGLLAGVLGVSLSLLLFFGDQLASLPRAPMRWEPLIVGVGLVYELLARYACGHLLRAGRPLPVVARYGTALVETSLPTCALLIIANFLGPIPALLSPVA